MLKNIPSAISPIANTLENLPLHTRRGSKEKKTTLQFYFYVNDEKRTQNFCEVNKECKTFPQQIAGFFPKRSFHKPQRQRWAGVKPGSPRFGQESPDKTPPLAERSAWSFFLRAHAQRTLPPPVRQQPRRRLRHRAVEEKTLPLLYGKRVHAPLAFLTPSYPNAKDFPGPLPTAQLFAELLSTFVDGKAAEREKLEDVRPNQGCLRGVSESRNRSARAEPKKPRHFFLSSLLPALPASGRGIASTSLFFLFFSPFPPSFYFFLFFPFPFHHFPSEALPWGRGRAGLFTPASPRPPPPYGEREPSHPGTSGGGWRSGTGGG